MTVNDLTGSATLNLLDAGDTASATGNITGTTVAGLGFGAGGSVAYTGVVAPATGGVTALNIDGGTSPSGGVDLQLHQHVGEHDVERRPGYREHRGRGIGRRHHPDHQRPGCHRQLHRAVGSTPLVTAAPPPETWSSPSPATVPSTPTASRN